MLQVVSHKHGACHGMTAYVFLNPGTYILQMRIDPHHCHHLVDEAGHMDREYTWNINVLPSVIEPLSAFIITPDTAKTKYMQVAIHSRLSLPLHVNQGFWRHIEHCELQQVCYVYPHKGGSVCSSQAAGEMSSRTTAPWA